MKGLSEDRRALVDARGKRYPFRVIGLGLADTVIRFAGLVAILFAIGLIWEAFH